MVGRVDSTLDTTVLSKLLSIFRGRLPSVRSLPSTHGPIAVGDRKQYGATALWQVDDTRVGVLRGSKHLRAAMQNGSGRQAMRNPRELTQ